MSSQHGSGSSQSKRAEGERPGWKAGALYNPTNLDSDLPLPLRYSLGSRDKPSVWEGPHGDVDFPKCRFGGTIIEVAEQTKIFLL